MPEEWRPAPGLPGYEVSDCGRVRSVPREMVDATGRRRRFPGCIRKLRYLPNGYVQVGAWVEGVQVYRYVHRLVCRAFHGPPPTPKHDAHHHNHDRRDNRAANLAWVTRRENIRAAMDAGRSGVWSDLNYHRVSRGA